MPRALTRSRGFRFHKLASPHARGWGEPLARMLRGRSAPRSPASRGKKGGREPVSSPQGGPTCSGTVTAESLSAARRRQARGRRGGAAARRPGASLQEPDTVAFTHSGLSEPVPPAQNLLALPAGQEAPSALEGWPGPGLARDRPCSPTRVPSDQLGR